MVTFATSLVLGAGTAHAQFVPQPMNLFVSQELAAGKAVNVRVTGGTPGSSVSIEWGSPVGSTCLLFGICVSIGGPLRTLGNVVIDADGTGRATFVLPATVTVPSISLVAIARLGPVLSRASPEVERVLIPPAAWRAQVRWNVLLIVGDDIGVDKVGAYGSATAPSTPNLDQLATAGVRFENVWATPLCSPTRVALLTGRYGRRTGWGVIGGRPFPSGSVGFEQVTLGELARLSPLADWSTAVIGKWHVSPDTEGYAAPELHGFDQYRGYPNNLADNYVWTKYIDEVAYPINRYAASEEADDTVAVIATLPEPWFVMLAMHAPHVPFQAPPADLSEHDALVTDSDLVKYDATVEAVDHELGRALDAIAPVMGHTLVIYVSDNGTTTEAVVAPEDPERAKATIYDGGIQVPLIISGPSQIVDRGTTSAGLASVVDIFATIADLLDVDTSVLRSPSNPAEPLALDGVSLLPVLADPATAPSPHETLYAEHFAPNGGDPFGHDTVAVRNDRFKLVRHMTGTEHFYEYLPGAVDEGDSLLSCPLDAEQALAYATLQAELDAMSASLVFDAHPFSYDPLDYAQMLPEGTVEDRVCVPGDTSDTGGAVP